MTDTNDEIPAELRAKLEVAFGKALEQHTNEVRRSFQISTGFYEKLAALDAGSIAIAASVGATLIAKAATPSPVLRSVSHWLVWIILSLWISLVSSVGHNFLVVGIAQLESAYSELDFIRKLMRESMNVASTMLPDVEPTTINQVLRTAEEAPQASQTKNVAFAGRLRKLSPILGYVSMAGFIGAYTLVAISTLRLWL